MIQTEILAQFEQMTSSQQQALLRKLQKAARKSARKTIQDDKLPLGAGRSKRKNREEKEPRLLTDKEKQALRAQVRHELGEGAYAPLEETEEQHRRRLAAILPAEAMTGVIRLKSGKVPTDEEVKEDYIKHLLRKYS